MKNTIINAKVEKLNELSKVLSIKREFGIRNAKNKVNEQNLNRLIFSIKDSMKMLNFLLLYPFMCEYEAQKRAYYTGNILQYQPM